MDVYKTVRSAATPQWYYDATFKNATQVKLVTGGAGLMPTDINAGLPFPIPKNGAEVMWNNNLRFAGHNYRSHTLGTLVSANGSAVLIQDSIVDTEKPLATKDASSKETGGDINLL